jgi:hypothetical protein
MSSPIMSINQQPGLFMVSNAPQLLPGPHLEQYAPGAAGHFIFVRDTVAGQHYQQVHNHRGQPTPVAQPIVLAAPSVGVHNSLAGDAATQRPLQQNQQQYY